MQATANGIQYVHNIAQLMDFATRLLLYLRKKKHNASLQLKSDLYSGDFLNFRS